MKINILKRIINVLFWLLPITNILWIKFIEQFDFGEKYIVNKEDNIFIELIFFLSSYTMLFLYLYLFVVNKFRTKYKLITIYSAVIQVTMLLIICLYYRINILLIDFLYMCLYFIPFYIIAYLVERMKWR